MKSSWGNVAKWYDEHLTKDKGNYHQTLIIPGLIRILKKYAVKSVLDLGCGQGIVTKAFAGAGMDVAGIDISPELIGIARSNYKSIQFEVGDVSEFGALRPFAGKKINAVTITLAIQNIENLDGVIRNAASILKAQKTGGYFIITLNHPAFRVPQSTSWGFEGNKLQYRRVDSYMSELKIPIEMKPGERAKTGKSEKTWSFHRPLSGYIQALSKNGFALVDMEEWVSNKMSEPGPRAKAENRARQEIPMFMVLIAKYLLNFD